MWKAQANPTRFYAGRRRQRNIPAYVQFRVGDWPNLQDMSLDCGRNPEETHEFRKATRQPGARNHRPDHRQINNFYSQVIERSVYKNYGSTDIAEPVW